MEEEHSSTTSYERLVRFGGGNPSPSSSNNNPFGFEARFCLCGEQLQLRTSWSESNPGRRYYKCRRSNPSNQGCGYFDWVDPPSGSLVAKQRHEIAEMIEKMETQHREFHIQIETKEKEFQLERKTLMGEIQRRDGVISRTVHELLQCQKRERLYFRLLVGTWLVGVVFTVVVLLLQFENEIEKSM